MALPHSPLEPPRLRVSQISIGRFHHFHLAREMEKRGLLESVFTGYPKFKLRNETGIVPRKIRSFPWLYAPYMARGRLGLTGSKLSREWAWRAFETLDKYAARSLGSANALVALSGCGWHAGRALKKRGGVYFCDRGSSHMRFQWEILREEFERWGAEFDFVNHRILEKEEAEYELADRITVPSEFAYRSFVEKGVSPAKLVKIPYGVQLERFAPCGEPDPQKFTILFIGRVGLRKGFPYLLEAFSRFEHPGKRLVVIGGVLDEILPILRRFPQEAIEFRNHVPNSELPAWFSRSHVLVLPSIEEGFGLVQAEAMACGCPVIASVNTGATELFEDGREGFIIPIRSSEALLEKLNWLAQDEDRRREMGAAALMRARRQHGWDRYGEAMSEALRSVREAK